MKKLLLLTLVCTLILSCKGGFTRTLVFSRDEVQAKVAQKFPIDREAAVVKLVLTHPDVILSEGSDRIGLKTDAEAKLPGGGLLGMVGIGKTSYKGMIYIDGEVDYDPAAGEFFFTKGKVKELAIEGVPEQLNGPVSELADAAASNNLNKVPLFKLNEQDMKERAAKFFLKKVKIKNGKLEITVGL